MPKPHTPDGVGETHPGSEYADDEVEFLKAMERFKRKRPFPTWTEVLKVLKSLGYRKILPPTDQLPHDGDDENTMGKIG